VTETDPSAATKPSLWRHRDFVLLWSGQTVSEVGSAITLLALPLLALVTLDATTFEVGALMACTQAAFLLVALPAGAWVDHWRKRRVLVCGDWGRVLLLASIPVAKAFGALTMAQLYVVALLTGVLTVFFDVAYMSYVPELVEGDQLVDANGKIGASQAFGQVAGPSLGGLLVGVLGAAYAIVADAASFAVSGFATLAIRHREVPPATPERRDLRADIREGLRFVLGHSILRKVVACTATSNFFSGALVAVEIVFLKRTLHASAGVIGLVFSVASIGGLVGGVLAGRISERVGSARLIWLSQTVAGPFGLLTAAAFTGWGVSLVAIAMFAFSIASVIYNSAQVSYRQAICPRPLLGRMNASVRFLVWGTLPLGGITGGALGTWIGLRPTVLVCALGMWSAALWVIFSPLYGLRDVPLPQMDDVATDETAGVGAQERDHFGDVVGEGDVATPAGDGLADLVGDPAGVGHRWVHEVGRDTEAGELGGR
jgi:MFS family permease